MYSIQMQGSFASLRMTFPKSCIEILAHHTSLEVELKSHLDLARRIDLALDVPETARVEGRIDIAELRVVKRVESFHPELQPRAFAHLVQRDFLEQRESSALGSRQAHVGHHAWGVANGVIGRHRQHVRSAGKVAVREPLRLGVDLELTAHVGNLPPVSGRRGPAVEAEMHRLAVVKAPDAVGLPAAQEAVHHGIPTRAPLPASSEGELIHVTNL